MARKYDEEKREKILESAITVFGNHGFTESTIKEIAEHAELSPGTVYTYFENKEDLFRSAVDEGWNRFILGMGRLRDDDLPFEKKLIWLIDVGFEVIKKLHPLLRGMYSDAARRSLIRSRLDRLIGIMEAIVLDGNNPGLFSEYKNEEIRKFYLRSLVQGVFFHISTTTCEGLDGEIDHLRSLLKESIATGSM